MRHLATLTVTLTLAVPAAVAPPPAGGVLLVVPSTAVSAVEGAGATVVERLDAVGQMVVEVPADRAAALVAAGATPADRPLAAAGSTFDPGAVAASSQVEGLDLPAGADGSGVAIALVDTGVDARAPLARRAVDGVDVTGGRSALRDGHGHGTFLAGLLSGVDSPGTWHDVPGAAPGAAVVSVKVADDAGTTTLLRLLQGLEWVLDNADAHGVRVVVLAYAAPATDGPDPLRAALEVLWAAGLTVVVPAGNLGAAGVTSPGDDPWLLTAGAADGDAEAPWSGRGASKPEVLAPGTRVVSARVPGSTIDLQHPAARIGPRLFRGSGTSFAAALVAGAAAVVIEDHPAATPDDVKGALVATAADRHVRVAAATAAPASPSWEQHHPLDPVLGDGDDMPWSVDGSWTGTSWTGTSWTGTSWTGTSWTGTSWTGTSWTGTSWTGTSWTGTSWTGTSWTGTSWTGTSWTGTSWTGGFDVAA